MVKNTNYILLLMIALFSMFLQKSTFAFEKKAMTNLHYFLCPRSSEVNVRNGPAEYFITLRTINAKSFPLLVESEIEEWVFTTDYHGNKGWIYKHLLKKNCKSIIKTNPEQGINLVKMHRMPSESSQVLLKLEDGVLINIMECGKGWCRTRIEKTSGWIKQSSIWGV